MISLWSKPVSHNPVLEALISIFFYLKIINYKSGKKRLKNHKKQKKGKKFFAKWKSITIRIVIILKYTDSYNGNLTVNGNPLSKSAPSTVFTTEPLVND
jgi:hypothetical protein